MNPKVFSIMNRRSLKDLQSNLDISAVFCYNTVSTRSLYSKNNLYSRISPLGDPNLSITPELNKWVEEGKKVRDVDLMRIIRDLRKRRRVKHALEISEWMANKGDWTLSSADHAVRLDLIGRVHGLDSAESYFNSLSEKNKTAKTYGALLNCYVKASLTDKSLSHLQKMKELGFASSPLCYNDLMCLYTNTGEYEKVPDLLNEMKENGVSTDAFSYRLCINSYGVRSNIDEMEKVLEEMENQPHISMDWNTYANVADFYIKSGLTDKAVATLQKVEEKLNQEDKKDGLGYNFLISLYASLGNKDEVMRFWKLKKKSSKRRKYNNMDYITMLGSLVKLEELEDAEKLLKDWESSGNSYDFRVPNVLLIAYSKRGMVEKAETMLADLSEKGKVPMPNSWGIVAAGYAHKDEMEKAVKCMKMAFSVNAGDGGWKPNPKVISSILQWLGDNGEVEEVEAFVSSLKEFFKMDENMRQALEKANFRAGKHEYVERMKAVIKQM